MDPKPHARIVVETAHTTPSSELRFLRRRNDTSYLRGTPLPPGIVARGHVVAPLRLSDIEAVVSGVTTIIPTTLVIENSKRRGDVAGLPFSALNFDGVRTEGTLDIRPGTTPMGAPKLLVDVVLRASDDEDATDHRADGPPPAAILGAVLAELRDLRHRLRTSPMTDRQVVDHVEAILAVANELEADRPGRAPRASSREGARATARRVAGRFAQVVLREGIEPSAEQPIARCSDDDTTIAGWEVHRHLLSRGYRIDDVKFVESWWPAQVTFVATRGGTLVVRGTVIIDARFDARRIETYATLRIDEVFEPNAYSVSADASLST
jgi:hypothetical protein